MNHGKASDTHPIHVTFNNKCWLSLRLVRWHRRRIIVELFGSPSNSQQGKRPLPERVHSNQHRHPSSDRRGIQVKQPWPWPRSTTSTIELLHNYCTFQQEWKHVKTDETSIQVWRHMTKLGWKEARLAPQNQNEQFWAVRQYVQLSFTKYEASRRKAGSYTGCKDVAAAVNQSPLRHLAGSFKHHIATRLGSAMGKQGFDSRTALANATWCLVLRLAARDLQHHSNAFLTPGYRHPCAHYSCETVFFVWSVDQAGLLNYSEINLHENERWKYMQSSPDRACFW